jgi:hypothetical protein
MEGPTPPKKDDQEESAYREYEINLEMWKHYDNLRQEKSKTFLTAQTILIAASGFVLKSQGLQSPLILAVSLLGFGSSVLWFGLLSRNAGYIRFHRKQVEGLESHTGIQFTTFTEEWDSFKETLWPRSSSNTIDRTLAALFVVFWLGLCGYGVLLFYTSRVFG